MKMNGQGQTYFQIDTLQLNPSQTHMAWLEDIQGQERFTLYIQNLLTKDIRSVDQSNIKWTLAWLDDEHVVYICGDDAERPCSVQLYNIHTAQSTLIWHESDEHFYVTVHRVDRKHGVCEAHSKTTSDVRLLEIEDTSWVLRHVQQREHGVKYSVEVGHTSLYIRSNKDKRNLPSTLRIETTIRFSPPLDTRSRHHHPKHRSVRWSLGLLDSRRGTAQLHVHNLNTRSSTS